MIPLGQSVFPFQSQCCSQLLLREYVSSRHPSFISILLLLQNAKEEEIRGAAKVRAREGSRRKEKKKKYNTTLYRRRCGCSGVEFAGVTACQHPAQLPGFTSWSRTHHIDEQILEESRCQDECETKIEDEKQETPERSRVRCRRVLTSLQGRFSPNVNVCHSLCFNFYLFYL